MIYVLSAGVAICQAVQAIREYKRKSSEDEPIKANSASVPINSNIEDDLARDQVRQEANLTLTQENLTTTQDSVIPDTVVLAPQEDTFHWSQPTLEQVLSRWYKLTTPTWAYTATQDTQILALDVSKSLFNVTSLFDRVKRFRYWRGGVRVRLQVNSTPFHYGSLFAAIVPYYSLSEHVASPIYATTWALSGQKCSGWLSANTGKPLELSCPFQVPHEYLDITQQDDVRPFYLYVCVMNPLKVAGGATNPSLQLSLFAQFTDLEILAPSEVTANSSSKKVVKADKEQKEKTKQGTLGKVAGAVSDVASKLTAIPVIGSIASAVAPIASMVGGIFDYFGWDKPTNISSLVLMTTRPGRSLNHGSGQDNSECIGLKPEQKLSTETKHFGTDDESTRSLLALIQTPMWNGSFTIANNQAVDTIFKRIWVRPYAPDVTDDLVSHIEVQHHDYLSYYSQFFTACRGGYRYFLHFDTSSYTTARIRVTFEPSNETVAAITDGGDSFSRIIDVNGTTSVVFEVPYCYPSARMPIAYSQDDETAANGQLLLSLVNPIQTNGSSSDVIFCNVFRCASDDFRFYQPHKFQPTVMYHAGPLVQTTERKPMRLLRANSMVEQLTQQTIATLGDGPKIVFDRVTEDEEIVSHNDFLHRYHKAQSLVGNTTPLYPTTGDSWYWMYPFRAYRGAVRLVSYAAATPVRGLVMNLATATEDLLSAGSYMALASTEIPLEVPYNNNVRFLSLRMAESAYPDAYDRFAFIDGTATSPIAWSAGDDFTLGLRRAPLEMGLSIPH
jgi:hypothetical protein